MHEKQAKHRNKKPKNDSDKPPCRRKEEEESDSDASTSDSDIDIEVLEKYKRGSPVDHKVRIFLLHPYQCDKY
jgi:hypothetical protein